MALVLYPSIGKEKNLPVFVNGVGVSYLQLPVSNPTSSSFQIMITVSGCGVINVDGNKYELPAGCGFFLSKDIDYSFTERENPGKGRHGHPDSQWTVDWVSFDISDTALLDELFTGERFCFFRFRDPASVSAFVREIGEVLENDSAYGGFLASAELYKLLISLNRETLEIPEIPQKTTPTVEAVIGYIDANYTDEITLGDLCEAAGGISEQYLCRLFKQYTGERPIEFILHKRISMARSYLEKTDMTIPDIAKITGFNNTSYFYRNFKKFTGISPLMCRQCASAKNSQ